ncbi:HAD family hydrolase [Nocardioides glacieisoli]|uniref:HAD family hydrolase n=1 Tax=Nocardioides glacieisoli TaxID=1168730 RepID=UPI001A9331C4|nr:HAD family hydrolase [Nocardioides glacieisoli]
MLRAVLFDLDDTLVDQASATAGAVVGWAEEHGITDPDVATRWTQVSETQYARYARREVTFVQMRRERVREFLAVALDDRRADDAIAAFQQRYEAGWVVFDDAVPTLRRAREAGLKVAVLTNGDEDQQRLKMDRLRLSDEIDVLLASSVLPAGKPDRRAFIHAVAHLGVDAEEALMVGNPSTRTSLARSPSAFPPCCLIATMPMSRPGVREFSRYTNWTSRTPNQPKGSPPDNCSEECCHQQIRASVAAVNAADPGAPAPSCSWGLTTVLRCS